MLVWSDTADGRITITAPDRQALLEDLQARMVSGHGFAVATLNLDHVVKLRRDAAFRAAYARHTHVTADGNPIVWFSRLAGQADVGLIPGSELIEPVAAGAARSGTPVALLGATEPALAAAAAALAARHPGLRVVLQLAPPMGFDPDGDTAARAIDAIRDSGARLVFLALGAPKQERFAARALAALPNVGFLSIGAGLDFIAGTQRRAPAWVRAIAAEWLWRMLSNPRRLAARYGACLLLLPGLLGRALGARVRTPAQMSRE
ncbi:MAG: WecB/TagA/CpsF family glycosyltransferase [Pseudomonadota bacterium]|nr:WecB/TagA/CpsF family glycosyltransferase [Pseudomonadota bacterium]